MKITKDHIKRFLQHQCTPEEAAHISRYLQQHPEKLAEWLPFDEWQHLDDTVPDTYPEEKIKQKLLHAIHQHDSKKQVRRKFLYMAGASAAAILIFLGILLNRPDRIIKEADYAVAEPVRLTTGAGTIDNVNPVVPHPPISNLYYINSGNEPMRLEPADGSVILLYPQSEIRFPEQFSDAPNRVFRLKGKARFEVAKDKAKPFIVHSSGLTTQALGTVFLVDELVSSHATKVSLIEGSIRVEGRQTATNKSFTSVLKPEEEIVFNRTELKVLSAVRKPGGNTNMDRGGYFEETAQGISFTNLALQDVFAILQQNYNIRITYRESDIRQKFYTGSFPKSTAVYTKVINEIEYLHHIDVQIDASGR